MVVTRLNAAVDHQGKTRLRNLLAHSSLARLFATPIQIRPIFTRFSSYVRPPRMRIGKCKQFEVKGIIRPFDLKEIYLFYYLIDAGEFSYSDDMH